MILEFTDDEIQVLRELLKERVLELRAEIRKADDSLFKAALRDEKEILINTLKKLGEVIE
ncbi:MAG TPA: hypothetical protein PKU94_07320 [Candidatus Hydrothermia bacterium]|mgnify:CR=1 FL=1|nr:hypothetical protein [Candidatus Hydrothermae bacterium]MDD3649730.1 hypothetical protein [Candidatus Hydrothermia bacterium]MDD5572659.1 hypothetical protein [Candidatus Hydrothermia bacterium]HOK23648.1 hypothetical protein [Candidatus Hydrothermia bacterium]HOL24371.1 hypothetical protein [Candidatus Hydrothermia bacterium]